MSETVEIAYTDKLVQDGFQTAPNTWDNTTDPLGDTGGSDVHIIGLIFDFSSLWNQNSDSDYIDQLGILPKSISLFASQNLLANQTWEVWGENVLNASDYDSSSLPQGRTNELQIAEYNLGELAPSQDEEFTFILGQRNDASTRRAWLYDRVFDENWKRVYATFRNTSASGRLALSLVSREATCSPRWHSSTQSGLEPHITVDQWNFHTGFQDFPINRGRAVHCGRSGLPAVANELIEDGWNPGIHVKRLWWDDEDRRNEAEPSDTERERLDEVTT